MSEELISIIIPVYNVEKYLPKCLESILCQTYPHIEVIVVNDGSTDNSGNICDKYAQENPRIKVLHQSNRGVSVARNTGLSQASGSYIGFVDPDDWISPHMYQTLYTELINRKADMAACGIYIATDKSIYSPKVQAIRSIEEFTSKEAVLSANRQNQIKDGPCDKLYRRHILPEKPFPEGRFFEDAYIMIDLINRCKKILYIDSPHYYYYQRKDSTCHTYTAKILKNQFEAAFVKSEKIKKYYPELKNFADKQQIIADTTIYALTVNKIRNAEEKSRLCCLIRNNLKQYSLQQLLSICWKRQPAALLIKYFPQGFRCYAVLETLVRKILIKDQINILRFRRSSPPEEVPLSLSVDNCF